jgi:hypothetical protein
VLARGLRKLIGFAPKVLFAIVFAVLGAIVAAVVAAVFVLNSKPELSVWHHADLDEEFTQASPVATIEEYLALEDRLFACGHDLRQDGKLEKAIRTRRRTLGCY